MIQKLLCPKYILFLFLPRKLNAKILDKCSNDRMILVFLNRPPNLLNLNKFDC